GSLERRLHRRARRARKMAGAHERAGDSCGATLLGGPVDPAPLRAARARRAGAPRPHDSSRGIRVSDARRLTNALAALGLVLLAVGVAVFAFAGALVAAGIVYLVAATPGGVAVQTLLLAGVIVGIFFSAAITVIISIVDFNRLSGVIHWLLGNLSPLPRASLALFAG